MSQLIELTMGAERKRSDNNYGSDGQSAYVKYEIHPNDDITEIINTGKKVLALALNAPDAKNETKNDKKYIVSAKGGTPGDWRNDELKKLGFKWSVSTKAFVTSTHDETNAIKLVDAAKELGFDVALITEDTKPAPTT